VCRHQLVERIDVPREILVDEFNISIGTVSHVKTTVDARHMTTVSGRVSYVGFTA
jgi:hypothetical protein